MYNLSVPGTAFYNPPCRSQVREKICSATKYTAADALYISHYCVPYVCYVLPISNKPYFINFNKMNLGWFFV